MIYTCDSCGRIFKSNRYMIGHRCPYCKKATYLPAAGGTAKCVREATANEIERYKEEALCTPISKVYISVTSSTDEKGYSYIKDITLNGQSFLVTRTKFNGHADSINLADLSSTNVDSYSILVSNIPKPVHLYFENPTGRRGRWFVVCKDVKVYTGRQKESA